MNMSAVDDNIIESRRYIRRANFHLQHNENDKAKHYYEEALKFNNQSTDLLLILSKLEKDQNLDLSIRYLRDALEIDEREEIKIQLGYLLLEQEKYEEALDLIKDLDNEDAELIKNLAYIKIDRYLQQVSPNLSLFSQSQKFLPHIGEYYHKIGEHAKALAKFRSAELNWQTYHAMGIQNYIMGTLSVAKTRLEDAYKQYSEGVENQEDQILEKLKIDKTFAIENPHERLEMFKQISHEHKNWRIHQAIFVILYQIKETDEDKPKIDEMKTQLERAIELCEIETVREDMITWRELLE